MGVEVLDKWKDDELAACEKKKQEYIEMYRKLGDEMKEMKEIASPGVAMDVRTGIVNSAAEVGFMQIEQGLAEYDLHAQVNPIEHAEAMRKIKFLINGTQSAAH